MLNRSAVRSLTAPTGSQFGLLRSLVVAASLVCLPLMANATPVNFTLNSSTSNLDLTATGSLASTPFTVTEQSAGSKANKVSNASGTFLQSNPTQHDPVSGCK